MGKVYVRDVGKILGLIKNGEMVCFTESGYSYRADLSNEKNAAAISEKVAEIKASLGSKEMKEKAAKNLYEAIQALNK